jgi:anthranilate phosphoribosyltransferase
MNNLIPEFLKAMDEIGQYGHEKYKDKSFQEQRLRGDRSRIKRCDPKEIASHASAHYASYLRGELHDHFHTRKHQLAAVAFNAMMEFYYAGLQDEY